MLYPAHQTTGSLLIVLTGTLLMKTMIVQQNQRDIKKVPTVNYTNHKQETTLHHDIKKVIKILSNQESFVKKYNYIRTLIHNHDPTIVDDSFKNSKGKDLTNAIRDTFDNENLNMVIAGRGICGLYPAYDIKSTLVKTQNSCFRYGSRPDNLSIGTG